MSQVIERARAQLAEHDEDTAFRGRVPTYLEQFTKLKALVIGDAIQDVYHFGRVERISPEAPVPIFVPERREVRPGGAANVGFQLKQFEFSVISHFGMRPSTKERYLVGHQMIFRCDRDEICRPSPVEVDWIAAGNLAGAHVVVLSDYAKGFLTAELCQAVIRAARDRNIPVVVDPKGEDWTKYDGASLVCPNEAEYKQERGLRNPLSNPQLLIKRGARGMTLLRYDTVTGWRSQEFAAQARHVYDVTGAGDTVVATVAAVLAAGGTLEDAARLAILTSGWVVGEVGTVACSTEVVRELVR